MPSCSGSTPSSARDDVQLFIGRSTMASPSTIARPCTDSSTSVPGQHGAQRPRCTWSHPRAGRTPRDRYTEWVAGGVRLHLRAATRLTRRRGVVASDGLPTVLRSSWPCRASWPAHYRVLRSASGCGAAVPATLELCRGDGAGNPGHPAPVRGKDHYHLPQRGQAVLAVPHLSSQQDVAAGCFPVDDEVWAVDVRVPANRRPSPVPTTLCSPRTATTTCTPAMVSCSGAVPGPAGARSAGGPGPAAGRGLGPVHLMGRAWAPWQPPSPRCCTRR